MLNFFSHRKIKCLSFLIGINLILTGCQSTVKLIEDTKSKAHCLEAFDVTKDYFPEKINPKYAKGFTVEYHNHYKIVTVRQPWESAAEDLTYIFVQCGAPTPTNYPEATIVEIPVQRVVAMSTTYFPHIEKLEQLETLVGVGDRRLIYGETIRERIETGLIQEVGSIQPDAEKIISLQPDIILSYRLDGSEQSQFESIKSLRNILVLDAAHLEPTPLGRAEWLKFTALLFNAEAKANQEFTAIATRYETLIQQTRSLNNQPTILSGAPFQGIWHVPGGQSYVAQMFKDAGVNYLWQDSDSRLSLPLDFEAVLAIAKEADIWVNGNPSWRNKLDMLNEDQRYGLFQASQQNQIYVTNARVRSNGGNDFWESGTTNPDIVLADLIKIFHPDLLPEHDLYYYQPLN